jgi:cytochrome c oxidase cbb3-type subunit 1
VAAMRPYYIARAIGGLMFLSGAAIGCVNIWMTIRAAHQPADERLADRPVPRPVGAPAFQPGE